MIWSIAREHASPETTALRTATLRTGCRFPSGYGSLVCGFSRSSAAQLFALFLDSMRAGDLVYTRAGSRVSAVVALT